MRISGERNAATAICPAARGEGSSNQADKEGADLTRAAVVGGDTCGNANEDRQRMDRKRKQQPAQKPKADEAEDDADNDHGGGLRGVDLTATPSTTSTAQTPK